MTPQVREAFALGLADATGFVGGALGGWWLGRLLGFDFVGSTTYDARALVGLVFILAGLGLGKWLVQRWRVRRSMEK